MSPEAFQRPLGDYITDFTTDFRLDPARTALVVVDMQYATGSRHHGLGRRLMETGRFEEARWRFDRIENIVVPNIRRLLAFFRGKGLPVVYLVIGAEREDFSDMPAHMRALARSTNNRVGTREHEILDEVKPAPGDLVFRKTTISAFTSTGLDTALRALGVTDLVFVGISTNMCVDTTARDAADRGYRCLLVEDACAAAKEEYHRFALLNFQRLFGRVARTDEVLAELEAPVGLAPDSGTHRP